MAGRAAKVGVRELQIARAWATSWQDGLSLRGVGGGVGEGGNWRLRRVAWERWMRRWGWSRSEMRMVG